MKHFSLTEWADFVSDIPPYPGGDSIQRHLDSGCKECLKTAEIGGEVMDFSGHARAGHPSAPVIRRMRSHFGPTQPALMGLESVQIAQLVFDSFRQPSQSGQRSDSSSLPRQLLYKCGTLCIDMRLEPKPGSNYVILVGQLIDAKKPLKGLEDVSVSLRSEGDKMTETTTNRFGEFHFGFESVKHMQLFFGMKESEVVVPLPESDPEAE